MRIQGAIATLRRVCLTVLIIQGSAAGGSRHEMVETYCRLASPTRQHQLSPMCCNDPLTSSHTQPGMRSRARAVDHARHVWRQCVPVVDGSAGWQWLTEGSDGVQVVGAGVELTGFAPGTRILHSMWEHPESTAKDDPGYFKGSSSSSAARRRSFVLPTAKRIAIRSGRET